MAKTLEQFRTTDDFHPIARVGTPIEVAKGILQ